MQQAWRWLRADWWHVCDHPAKTFRYPSPWNTLDRRKSSPWYSPLSCPSAIQDRLDNFAHRSHVVRHVDPGLDVDLDVGIEVDGVGGSEEQYLLGDGQRRGL